MIRRITTHEKLSLTLFIKLDLLIGIPELEIFDLFHLDELLNIDGAFFFELLEDLIDALLLGLALKRLFLLENPAASPRPGRPRALYRRSTFSLSLKLREFELETAIVRRGA